MLESALLDVDPDDAMELNRKKRIMRWDAKKRKFVKVRRPTLTRTSNLIRTHKRNTAIAIDSS
jgi:ATP-dependent RNA helicase DDX54/DBP10